LKSTFRTVFLLVLSLLFALPVFAQTYRGAVRGNIYDPNGQAMPGAATDSRVAATWTLVQFLSGVWAGVLGANSPFLHGLVAGVPSLVLGLAIASTLPTQFVALSWFLAPAAALVAAALMRFVRHRG